MSRPVLAHVVGGGPTWPLWITGTLLFGGAVATLAVPLRWRRVCLAVCGVGLVATVVTYALLPSSPPAPQGVSVSFAAPVPTALVTSPVLVKVCDGALAAPGAGRLLSISVDGRQVAEVDSDTAAVAMSAGRHTLRAELVTASHLEYAPPLRTEEDIVVSGVGTLPQVPACPAGH